MGSSARQAQRPRRRRLAVEDQAFKYWPVFALLPVIVVGQIKATGFVSIGGVDTTVLSVAFLLVVTALTFLRERRYPVRLMLPYFVFALVVFWGVTRSMPGAYQDLKARDFFLLTGVVVLCLPILLRDARDLRGLLAVWFAGGVLVATVVLVVGGAEDLYGRAGIGEATLGPAYLSSAAVVVGCAGLGERLFPAFVVVPGVLVSGIALVAIGSRGPVIAAVVGLTAWVLVRGLFRGRTILVILVAAAVAVVAANHATDAALSRFVLEDPARRELWATARATFLDAPLLGLGWGDFYLVSMATRLAEYPHNLFLETAAELGLVGLVTLLALLGVMCVRTWRSRFDPNARLIAALAVAMLVGQQFSADLTNRLFWIAVVPCLLLPKLSKAALAETRSPG